MKTIIINLLFCSCLLTVIVNGQTTANQISKQDYNIARNRSIAAWSFLGAGVLLNGVFLFQVHRELSNMFINEVPDPQFELLVFGAGAMLGSIPLFIGASKQKRLAANFALGYHSFPAHYLNHVTVVAQPAIVLQINL